MMPWVARYEGEKSGAFEVPHGSDAHCLECGERMRVWRESESGTARHFKHIGEMGDSGGAGSHCSGGEGDEHRKWKNFAAERLSEVFGNIAEVAVEKRLAAPHTGKTERYADAAVMFDETDEQLGHGLAVEVQHKNDGKDIEATTRDYLKQGVAVAWLDGSDFWECGCLLDHQSFRERARQKPSPLYFRETHISPPHIRGMHITQPADAYLRRIRADREELNMDSCDHDLQPREHQVPAKLPVEYFDEVSEQMWQNQQWRTLFSGFVGDELSHLEVDRYIQEVRNSLSDGEVLRELEPTAVIPERLLRDWYKSGFKKTHSRDSYYVRCPNCDAVSGPYNYMVKGSRRCSCGISFSIDTVLQTAGEILSDRRDAADREGQTHDGD